MCVWGGGGRLFNEVLYDENMIFINNIKTFVNNITRLYSILTFYGGKRRDFFFFFFSNCDPTVGIQNISLSQWNLHNAKIKVVQNQYWC